MMTFRLASKTDLDAIQVLLKSLGLPYEDCGCHVHNFLVIESDGAIIAAGGLEIYAAQALLRSMAIAPAYQRCGLGVALYAELKNRALSLGVQQLFVLTETAVGYFARLGFKQLDRGQVPDSIKQTRQFSGMCRQSAAVMYLDIAEQTAAGN